MIANESARLLDIAQAARCLRVSRDTIRRRIADGSLEAYRVGAHGNIRVSERALSTLLIPYQPPKGNRT